MTLKKQILISLMLVWLVGVVSLAQNDRCEVGGQVLRAFYDSDIAASQMVYSIYLPPCHDSSDSAYPVIYLLHGSNEDDNQWLRLGLAEVLDSGIASGDIPPVIVVMPFGNWIANETRFGDDSWPAVFLQDLMPHIETTYPVDAQQSKRAIGGISRGGFWAYNIALRHPELFIAVGGHSAFFDMGDLPAEFDPRELVANQPVLEALQFWLDRSLDDYAAPGMDAMADRMRQHGLNYIYEIYPEGEHNNDYWRLHLDTYLTFYVNALQDSNSAAEVTPVTDISQDADGLMLFLPVVSFPSLQTTLTMDRLTSTLSGMFDEKLILDLDTDVLLKLNGVQLHPDTMVVERGVLENRLWRDRTRYTFLPVGRLTQQYRVLWVDDVHPLDRLVDYPLAFESTTPNFFPHKLTRITLSGVTALTRNTLNALDENGVDWAGEAIGPYVKQADFFHTSNEVSIYPTCPQTNGPQLGGVTSFCSKESHFDLLLDLEVDIVELTGNHNNDYGYDAYLDTLMYYQDAGISTVGGGTTLADAREPLYLDHHGNRVAWIACNAAGPYYALVNEDEMAAGGVRPGATACDWDWLAATLPVLGADSDLVIVTIQHQEFEDYVPTDQQRFDFRRLADLGADVVIGTAPHKPQTFEFYATTRDSVALLHYGLGNLFFDQPYWGNMRFFMDTLFIYDGQLVTVEVFPGIIEEFGRPRLMTLDERENFLHFMFIQQNGF